jgi:hypothetical protein
MSRVGAIIDGIWIGNSIFDQIYIQITTAQAKSSQSAFISRFLVKDLNNGDSSAYALTPLPAG